MCYALKKTRRKSVIGYKVVAKKVEDDRSYYSIATGIKYPSAKAEKLPRCELQNQIGNYFLWDLTDRYSRNYVEELQGKTSIFLKLKDAKMLHRRIKKNQDLLSYSFIMVKIKITDNIYSGLYNIPCNEERSNIMIGERMEFLKEY